MDVTLEYVTDEAHRIKTFWFRPERPVRRVAGQFTQLQLPLEQADERGDKHWFTISSSPSEELIGITSKFAPDGSAFKSVLQNLEPGTRLTLAEPMGDFVLPKDKSIPLLFVAGGIGITPYRSMIKWLADSGERRDVHLVHSVRDVRELAFRELFESHESKFTPVVTEPDAEWPGETGALSAERIMQLAEDQGNRTLIYMAGPEPMVEQFADELRRLGLPGHRLVSDYFHGYSAV